MKKDTAGILIAVTLIFAALTVGILIGRLSGHEAITIETVSKGTSPQVTTATVSQVYTGKVNINTASAEELELRLPGIGPTLASRIVEYREKNGPFETIYDITKVEGIGDKTMKELADLICVEDGS